MLYTLVCHVNSVQRKNWPPLRPLWGRCWSGPVLVVGRNYTVTIIQFEREDAVVFLSSALQQIIYDPTNNSSANKIIVVY